MDLAAAPRLFDMVTALLLHRRTASVSKTSLLHPLVNLIEREARFYGDFFFCNRGFGYITVTEIYIT